MFINIAHRGFHEAHSQMTSVRMLNHHKLPLSVCMGFFLQESPHKILGISRMTSSSQQHVLLASEFKRLPDYVCFLLHTYVTFFSGTILACVGAQVKLQSSAICPILWKLKHSMLFMNKNSWLLAKFLLEDWWGSLNMSLWYALKSFAMCPKFVQE